MALIVISSDRFAEHQTPPGHPECPERADVMDAWPESTGEVLFYQGMFCYFAFGDEPAPDPMTRACRSVHERYAAEPLLVEDLHTEGYSALQYAQGGQGVYRIGFYRLTPHT